MAKNTVYTGRRVILPRAMLQSAAFRSLTTGTAHIVLMTFMLKRQVEPRDPKRESWEVVNDNTLVYTYKEAERQGISATSFRNAIDMLLDRGFIRIAKTGKGRHRAKTFYGLADGWRTWHPGDPPKDKRKRRQPAGRPTGFQRGNRAWQKRKSSTDRNSRRSTDKNSRRSHSAQNSSRKNSRSFQR